MSTATQPPTVQGSDIRAVVGRTPAHPSAADSAGEASVEPTWRSDFRFPLSLRYILQRLLTAAIAVFSVFSLVYLALVSTGNPAQLLVSTDASADEVAAMSTLMGFDRPPLEQYLVFLGQVFSGQFPDSLRYGVPSLSLVLERLPATITLGLTGLTAGFLIGGLAGYLGATSRFSALRRGPTSVLAAFDAIPTFFFGIVLIFIFSVQLKWLPASQGGSLSHLVLPATALAVVVAAPVSRIFRASLLDTVDLDHVRLARAKGISGYRVNSRHVVANSLPPVLNVVGVQAGMVLGGAIVTETLFSWPGVGQLSISALNNRDYPLVLACVAVIAIGFVLINLLVDLIGAMLDPRSRR